jgi:membrane associated rhomboid family serine protease
MFLHGGYLHLAGNMLFLWLFGNAVCGMIGNRIYLVAFPLCGVLAITVHNLFFGGPVIGASGAINGVIGFFLAICPVNRVTLFYWVVIRVGNATLPAWFIILVWFGFDIYGAAKGTGMTAYWAHIGGFLSGLAVGLFVLCRNWMVLTEWDKPTLLELLSGRRTAREALKTSDVES